ncbi:MAG TPA: cyclophilin-like fold protein [Candidatus Bathyarchaeia archaeon]|nr:cyclophilin-like fold protein [Candidatus Bathyarchaeia archaeon]
MTEQTQDAKPVEDVTRYRIRLIAEGYGEADAELIRFQSPVTVDRLAEALPFEGRAARWKEEIYFETPVKLGSEKAKSKVEIGSMAYWPMGSALCIFYGPTQPYSPVNVVGRVVSNLEMFRGLKSGTKVRVERVQAAASL